MWMIDSIWDIGCLRKSLARLRTRIDVVAALLVIYKKHKTIKITSIIDRFFVRNNTLIEPSLVLASIALIHRSISRSPALIDANFWKKNQSQNSICVANDRMIRFFFVWCLQTSTTTSFASSFRNGTLSASTNDFNILSRIRIVNKRNLDENTWLNRLRSLLTFAIVGPEYLWLIIKKILINSKNRQNKIVFFFVRFYELRLAHRAASVTRWFNTAFMFLFSNRSVVANKSNYISKTINSTNNRTIGTINIIIQV